MGSALARLFVSLMQAGLFNNLWRGTSITTDATYLVVIGEDSAEGVKIVDAFSGKDINSCKYFEIKTTPESGNVALFHAGVPEEVAEAVLKDVLTLITKGGSFSNYDLRKIYTPPVQGKTLDAWFKTRAAA